MTPSLLTVTLALILAAAVSRAIRGAMQITGEAE